MTRRDSKSRDWRETTKREQRETMEGFMALYGGAVKAGREDAENVRREARERGGVLMTSDGRVTYGDGTALRCPECGTTDRRNHAPDCKLGPFAEMGKR